MRNLKVMRLGHDVKGYMITDDDTLEIISKHRTEDVANKVLNMMLKKYR